MTDREELEFKRLEVNIHKLIELVGSQRQELRDLRTQLSSMTARLKTMQQERDEALQQSKTNSLAASIGGMTANKQQALEKLDEIINEVAYCIQQLETE